jgi:hypothetical protein
MDRRPIFASERGGGVWPGAREGVYRSQGRGRRIFVDRGTGAAGPISTTHDLRHCALPQLAGATAQAAVIAYAPAGISLRQVVAGLYDPRRGYRGNGENIATTADPYGRNNYAHWCGNIPR